MTIIWHQFDINKSEIGIGRYKVKKSLSSFGDLSRVEDLRKSFLSLRLRRKWFKNCNARVSESRNNRSFVVT